VPSPAPKNAVKYVGIYRRHRCAHRHRSRMNEKTVLSRRKELEENLPGQECSESFFVVLISHLRLINFAFNV
jgi:hypothetical protein